MSIALFFLISALRAVVEMIGLCLLGQGVLYLLAGKGAASNPIFRLFDLVTKAPRRIVAQILPRNWGSRATGTICFAFLFLLWLGLAYLRKYV